MGTSLWAPACLKSKSKRLLTVHKKAISIVDNSKCNEPIENIQKRLTLIDFGKIVDMELSKLGYQYKNSTLPIRVYNLFGQKPKHKYETRRRDNPLIIKHSSDYVNKSFLVKCPSKMQEIPLNITNEPTIATFKSALKKFFLEQQ